MRNIKVAKALGVCVAVTGVTVMIGWVFNIGFLKSISPGWVTMKYTTAFAFILCGVSLYFMAKSARGESKRLNQEIAEHKKTEEALREELEKKNKELEKLDQLKSEFVSTVSHELRTPLSIMKEGVSVVLDNLAGSLNPGQRKLLEAVYTNTNRLAKIISDLLDISKIEAGRIQLKKTLEDICQVVNDTADKWRLESDKKKQILGLSACLPYPVYIYIDADKIIQVLNNLISNAIKYTPAGGKISLELKDKPESTEVSVSDTGIGIPEDDFPRVFGKFQQFSRVPGAGEKGTGLGLAITKELVELHHGKITFESKLNEGSKFTFTLPKITSEEVFREHIDYGIRESNEKNSHLSLVAIQIAGFPDFQKEFGRDKAISLLKDIEKVVQGALRSRTDAVIRDSGELIVLLFDTNGDQAAAVRQRIEEVIRKYFEETQGEALKKVRFNIGYASYPGDANTDEDLLDKARGRVNPEHSSG